MSYAKEVLKDISSSSEISKTLTLKTTLNHLITIKT
jgi:hypothetical protein